MLDTDQLRSFLAIVDTGSFTRAAERVNKTQSAVSMHVRRLEEQLGWRALRQAGAWRQTDGGRRAADRLCPADHAGRSGGDGGAFPQGVEGRGAARHSRRLRRGVSRRHPDPLQPRPPAGRDHGRLREFGRTRFSRACRRARARARHRSRRSAGFRADPRGAVALDGLAALQGARRRADPVGLGESGLHLAAGRRRGARRAGGIPCATCSPRRTIPPC